MLATAFHHSAEEADRPAIGPAPGRTVVVDGLSACAAQGTLRTLAGKEHIFCEGDPARYIYLVEAGHVCIYKALADGRRQVIDFAYPGDWIGLGAIGAYGCNAQATTRTRLKCVPTAALHDTARTDAGVGLKLYEAVSRELIAARELLFTVSQCTATERLASFLLALSRRNERRGEDAREIVLPMTRADIADFLGLTIETVSRTFTKLKAHGLIDLEQNILVTIRDPQRLGELAEGKPERAPL